MSRIAQFKKTVDMDRDKYVDACSHDRFDPFKTHSANDIRLLAVHGLNLINLGLAREMLSLLKGVSSALHQDLHSTVQGLQEYVLSCFSSFKDIHHQNAFLFPIDFFPALPVIPLFGQLEDKAFVRWLSEIVKAYRRKVWSWWGPEFQYAGQCVNPLPIDTKRVL